MNERKNVELFVGLFLFMGFCVIAGMIVIFGSKGSKVRNSYDLVVEFPNAEGLIRNSMVMLSGATIGQVSEPPKLASKSYQVEVDLKILNGVRIPRGSSFIVESSGLMGDKFVNVVVPPKYDPEQILNAGERVTGASHGGGFEELTDKGSVVMDQLTVELKQIDAITTTLNQQLLNEQNLANIRDTFANLKTTTESLKAVTQKLDVAADKAGGTLDAAKATINTAGETAGDLRLAVDDVRKTLASATKAVDSAKMLFSKASSGDGTLGMLINDRKTAEDLKSLIANLRRSGVLFYKDRPAAPQSAEPPRR